MGKQLCEDTLCEFKGMDRLTYLVFSCEKTDLCGFHSPVHNLMVMEELKAKYYAGGIKPIVKPNKTLLLIFNKRNNTRVAPICSNYEVIDRKLLVNSLVVVEYDQTEKDINRCFVITNKELTRC